MLNHLGLKVVVVTNQSGIARGYFDEDMLSRIHEKMKSDLAVHDAYVDAVYYCPHHPDDLCPCRKPGTELFRRAATDLDIDLGESFVVGDLPIDIAAGRTIGCRTILVATGPDPVDAGAADPDYAAASMMDAVTWIRSSMLAADSTAVDTPRSPGGQDRRPGV